MKNRRTAIIAFLLCACLAIGAGYATVSDNLVVNGQGNVKAATADDFNLDIYFTGTPTKTTTGTSGEADEVAIDPADNDTATMTINSLKTVGEVATFTFDIHNAGTETNSAATLLATKTVGDPSLFEVMCTLGTHSLAPGATTTLTVTVRLLRVPAADIADSAVSVTVEATQAS